MRVRAAWVVAAMALAAALAPLTPSNAEGTASGAEAGLTMSLHGRLVVVPAETPGGHPAYGVALADGDIVPVRGRFGAHARTGDRVRTRLALPRTVARQLTTAGVAPTPGTDVSAASDAGRTALDVVAGSSLTLPLAQAPTVTAPAASVTPVVHRQYVAAVDNLGTLGETDAQLLAHVSTVGSYWQKESGGAISGITVPTTVQHYATTLPTTDCGLGADFFDVVQEAEKQFPGIDPFGGTDQLVVFVPDSCNTGQVVGEGSVGTSFASGGALVVKADASVDGTYAHETGHNYGFEHANVRDGADSLEYYGTYDVMGFALQGFNQLTALSTPYRVFQGITQPGEIADVSLGAGNVPVQQTATIRPRSDDNGLRSIRVTDPATGRDLYLDYRSGTGIDSGAFYTRTGYYLKSPDGNLFYAPGIVITAARNGSGVDDLVTTTTGDTSIPAGGTWTNASKTLTVHVNSLTSAGASVTVSYRPTLAALQTARPTITGRARVGRTLTAAHGRWTPGTTFTYAWYADGHRILHRSGSSLRLARAQRGRRITVKVTGHHPGYQRAARRSAPTAVVR